MKKETRKVGPEKMLTSSDTAHDRCRSRREEEGITDITAVLRTYFELVFQILEKYSQ